MKRYVFIIRGSILLIGIVVSVGVWISFKVDPKCDDDIKYKQ